MKKMIAGWALALLTAGILAWSQTQSHSEPSIPSAVHSKELLKDVPVPWSATKNTIRLNTTDPVSAAVLTSKTLWQSTNEHSRPQTVTLVDSAHWSIAAVSVDLTQLNEGPLLFVEEEGIPKETLEELRRLKPRGSEHNKGIEIITVGPISDRVMKELNGLEYKTDHIPAGEPEEAAAAIDEYAAKVSGSVPTSVIVGSMDRPDYTLPAVSWIAHMPETMLYVREKNVPEETAQALHKRKGKANIYIIGPEKVVSRAVEDELRQYGKVTRISGDDPFENAIHFAQFHDPATGFGWGVQSPGYSLSFSTPDSPILSIAAAPLSHMGKRAPLLFTERDGVPRSITKYVESIRHQSGTSPLEAPYNHAWIIGDEQTLTTKLQSEIDEILDMDAGRD